MERSFVECSVKVNKINLTLENEGIRYNARKIRVAPFSSLTIIILNTKIRHHQEIKTDYMSHSGQTRYILNHFGELSCFTHLKRGKIRQNSNLN